MTGEATPWNHNVQYYDRLLKALPDDCRRVLDVGCGDGLLTRALAERGLTVVALDPDPASVATTRAEVAGQARVEVVEGDVMDPDLDLGTFDAVLAVASLHHLPLDDGLRRLSALVAPGGLLGVVGLARSRSMWDVLHDAVGSVVSRVLRRRRGWSNVSAATVDPDRSYSRVLRVATLLLPGCHYRRHLLFRYSLLWTRPG
ncbi:MAG: class I SAM-dependent methyltransferase [Iamia sp.]